MFMHMLAQLSGIEAGLAGGLLTLLGGVLLRQARRERSNDTRMAKVIEDKDRYARDLAAKNETLVINNTRALIELTEALKDRPCLQGDPRANLAKRKETPS